MKSPDDVAAVLGLVGEMLPVVIGVGGALLGFSFLYGFLKRMALALDERPTRRHPGSDRRASVEREDSSGVPDTLEKFW